PPPISGLPTAGEYEVTPRPPAIPSTPPAVILREELPKTAQEAQGGPVETVEIQQDSNRAAQLGGDGTSVVTFDEYTGTFYRITPDGVPTKMTDQTFTGAQKITWAPQTDKAFIEFPDGSNIVYNFEEKKQISIPSHWTEPSFSPDGTKISMKIIGEDPDNRWFAVADADGSNARVLEPLLKKAGFFIPSWSPSGQVAGFFREGIDGDRQKLFFLGLNGENFKAAVVAGRGLEFTWSPQGDKLLHSVYSSSGRYLPELWIVNALGDEIGDNRRRLKLNTWAHKCAFADNETVYCAVPVTLKDGAGLLPSYGDVEEDHIYRIDLTTGYRQRIAMPAEKHTIQTLVVSKDQDVLYFVDKFEGNLFKIDL
ncbi:MAG: hypothetical protein AAB416_00870, partial [Patescibacteria group bacterium]